MEVNEEWLSEIERLEKYQKAAARVQGNMPQPKPISEGVPQPHSAPPTQWQHSPVQRESLQPTEVQPLTQVPLQRRASQQREQAPPEKSGSGTKVTMPPDGGRVLRPRNADQQVPGFWKGLGGT